MIFFLMSWYNSLYAMSNIFNGFYNLKDIRGQHGANKAKILIFYFKSDFDSLSSLSFYSYNKMYDKYICRACLRRCGLKIKKMLSFWQLRVGVFDRFNHENQKSSVKYVSRCIQEIAMSNIFNGFYNLKDIRGQHGANKAKILIFYFKSDFDSLSSLDSIWNFLNASGNIFNWALMIFEIKAVKDTNTQLSKL
jgi:hypothetical protein